MLTTASILLAVVAVAIVMTSAVAAIRLHRWHNTITVWFEVSTQGHLIVHATNTGRRPATVEVIALRGPLWKPGRCLKALAVRGAPAQRSTLAPGASATRTIAPNTLEDHFRHGRNRVTVRATGSATRSRRIPAGLVHYIRNATPTAI
jgi:hypothetical protein